jgi:hypothetical protein
MNYNETADKILHAVGGAENIRAHPLRDPAAHGVQRPRKG